MGFEHFRVELRGGKATFREAEDAIRGLSHVEADLDSIPLRGTTSYVINDGRHVFELELTESPVSLSCRFTLCHPPSVDAAFLGLVRVLISRLGTDVEIRDDVPPEHARSFALSEFEDFATVAVRCIAARRKEWIMAFGDESLSATTTEVYRRVILPRCQPGVEQPA